MNGYGWPLFAEPVWRAGAHGSLEASGQGGLDAPHLSKQMVRGRNPISPALWEMMRGNSRNARVSVGRRVGQCIRLGLFPAAHPVVQLDKELRH